jgi:hypothetical protein
MKKLWIACGALVSLTSLSIAMGAVPPARSVVTDDTAIYQHLSEIKISRETRPNFDGDIARLTSLEPAYREKLPSLSKDPRLAGPMKRIASQQYHYTPRKKSVASSQ